MGIENPGSMNIDQNSQKSKHELKEELMEKIEKIEGEMDNVMDRADKCKLELASIAATVAQEDVKENLQKKIEDLDGILEQLSTLHKLMSEEVSKLSE